MLGSCLGVLVFRRRRCRLAAWATETGVFDRYLTVWVALGIATGVGLGLVMPGLFPGIAALEVAHVNLVVAVFIWIMVYPMVIQIDFAAVRDVSRRPRGLLLALVVNWLVKPFTMAALAVLFFEHQFAPWVVPRRPASTSPA